MDIQKRFFIEPTESCPHWLKITLWKVLAHPVQNPVDYAIATTIGAGMRDEEMTISFAKMIHRKIKAQEPELTFPISAENLSAVPYKVPYVWFSTQIPRET